MALNLDLNALSKELCGAGIVAALITMDYLHISDDPLKMALLTGLGSIFAYGAVKNGAQSVQELKKGTDSPQ